MKFCTIIYPLSLIILSQFACNIVGDCVNHVYKQTNNSKGDFKIVKFDRGCGATTGNSIQLSVIKVTDSLPNDGGNIFISDSKVGGYIERDTSVITTWLDDTTILIAYDKDLEIFKNDSIVNGVKIFYQQK